MSEPVWSQTDTGYRLAFGDSYSIALESLEGDRFRRLWGTVSAWHGDTILLNTARFDLLNQRDRESFALGCAAVNGQAAPDWASRLLLLCHQAKGALDAAQRAADMPPGTRHAADLWPTPAPLPGTLARAAL